MQSNSVENRSLETILSSFWSEQFGFPIGDLEPGEVRIVGVDRPINIPPRWRLVAMKVHESCVIPVDCSTVGDAEEIARWLSVTEVFTSRGIARLQGLLGVPSDRVACWLHLYCDSNHFRPYEEHEVRRLTESDRRICEDWHLKYPRAIGPYSYQYANPIPYGMVLNGELVSVAVVLRYNLPFWEIGVETKPDCRGRGYAKSVVSIATRETLVAGKIAWYYLDTDPLNGMNVPSMRVAKALGYVEYSQTLNCRVSS